MICFINYNNDSAVYQINLIFLIVEIAKLSLSQNNEVIGYIVESFYEYVESYVLILCNLNSLFYGIISKLIPT